MMVGGHMSTRNRPGNRSAIRTAVLATVGTALILPAGWATAAPKAGERALALSAPAGSPVATQVARVTMEAGPRLQVRVGPARKGPEAWKFTLQREAGGSWEPVGEYRTIGTRDEISLPVAAGTYRVVVPAQYEYRATTSQPQAYLPTPDITVGGYGALEVRVGPIRAWQVTLERRTDQGWSKVETAKTRGTTRIVFSVGAGTYRIRTEANGRFPAYTGKAFEFTPQAPPGPIPYGLIDAAFSGKPVPAKKSRSVTPRSSSSNCASVMSSSSAGVDVAVGYINLIPYVGGSLGLGLADVSSNSADNAAEACLSGQFATINSQLAYQESQIAQIQNELKSAELKINQAFMDASYIDVQNDQEAFAANVQNLAQCAAGGFYYDFMIDFGFWDGCYAPTAATIQGVATSETYASQYSFGGDNQESFNDSLMAVSAMDVNTAACSARQLPNPPSKPQADCYKQVQSIRGQAVTNLQQALTTALNATISDATVNSQNVVPLYDEYNQYLVGYYQQSVVALQAGYTLESLINQLNYYNAGKSPAAIDSLGVVPGTYYSYQDLQSALGSNPSASAQAQYYNLAQKALTQVYVARMNQLYLDTIGFVVTDGTVGNQAWPSATDGSGNRINAGIDYAISVGAQATTATGGLTASTPIGLLPKVSTQGGSWMSNAALYQYYGLRNAGVCYANLLQWNMKNGTAVQGQTGSWYPTAFPSQDELSGGAFDTLCPPILTTATGGSVSAPSTSSTLTSCPTYAVLPEVQGGSGSCYDGNTLVPYYAAAGSLPELGSSVLTNLLLCSSNDPSLTWFQVGSANAGNAAGLTEGDWALTCGNWAPVGAPGWSKFPQSTPPTSWTDSTTFACPLSAPAAYCQSEAFGFWGSFYAWQEVFGDLGPEYPLLAYTFPTFPIGSGYYAQPNQGPLYVPPSTATPLNVGGPNATTTVSVDSPTCVSVGTVDAAVSDCMLSFSPVQGVSSPQGITAESGLATVGIQLPSNAAANTSTGGMFLPLTVGAVYGVESLISRPSTYYCKNNCTLLQAWLPTNTSIAQVGYFAPASSIDPSSYLWSQTGYITVADGSCWNINVGRNADNQGTISFNQMPLGSQCAV
jgi:hypothetical protein